MERTRIRQQHLSAQHYLGGTTIQSALVNAVRLIARHFDVPMVQVNVLDADQQMTIAAVGTPLGTRARADSLCDHVLRRGRITTLAQIDERPASAAHVNAYIGVPLTGREGLVVGTLCLLDTVPRQFGEELLSDLHDAAAVVQSQLELMRRLRSAARASAVEAAEILAAVEIGQIVPFYQPIVDLETGSVRAVEALARWIHPDRGLVAPDQFIPLAEDSEIIIDLDLSVLRQSAVQVSRWRTRHPALRLNVNLSARHVDHPDCLRRLRETVESAGLEPKAVTFELTETAAVSAPPTDRDFLLSLRNSGFQVVLDDFGSGFASIDQVLRLPIDGIKLNRSLTAAMGTRLGDAVIRHLVALATDLELDTVVEGIETDEQRRRARQFGARLGQGHVWAAALPATDMTAHLGGLRSPRESELSVP